MRTPLYLHMVSLINLRRTWIKAVQSTRYEMHIFFPKYGHCRPCVCRTLVLQAMCFNDSYKAGTEWHIPEFELDRALALYRKRTKHFSRRIAAGVHNMTTMDINQIIEIATHGTVKLNLRYLSPKYPFA